MPVIDLTGRTFGRLTVECRAGSTPARKALWRCICSCGGSKVVMSHFLIVAEVRSCGCLHRERAARLGRGKAIDMLGRTFGRLTVVLPGPRGNGELRWICACSCGRVCAPIGSRLRGGFVRSCGCLRDETMRERAPRVGAIRRRKKCRTCGQEYEAVGRQVECSDDCRLAHHVADMIARRQEDERVRLEAEMARLREDLARRAGE